MESMKGMWYIENIDIKNGGLLQYRQQFRLKHLATDMYLNGDPKKAYLSLSKEQNDPYTLFYFQAESNLNRKQINENVVQKDEFGYLMC